MTTATTAYFLIVSTAALVLAGWAWCLAVAARATADIAAEDADAALDDVQALADEVDVLHRTVGTDPDAPVDLVPVDDEADDDAAPVVGIDEVLTACLSQPVVLVDRGWAPLHEWSVPVPPDRHLDSPLSSPLAVLGSVPAEDPTPVAKHRRAADPTDTSDSTDAGEVA